MRLRVWLWGSVVCAFAGVLVAILCFGFSPIRRSISFWEMTEDPPVPVLDPEGHRLPYLLAQRNALMRNWVVVYYRPDPSMEGWPVLVISGSNDVHVRDVPLNATAEALEVGLPEVGIPEHDWNRIRLPERDLLPLRSSGPKHARDGVLLDTSPGRDRDVSDIDLVAWTFIVTCVAGWQILRMWSKHRGMVRPAHGSP